MHSVLCEIVFQDENGLALFKSIQVEDVPELISQMVSGPLGQWYLKANKETLLVSSVTSHMLRAYLLDGMNHPAKDYPLLFSSEFPHGVLSYEWNLGMLKVSEVLNDQQVLNHPQLLGDATVRCGKNGKANPRVWVDIFFVDQLARNIPVELGVAQEYYILCILHIVAGSESFLTRGWCLWELGLRAHSKKESLIIGSFGNTVRPSALFLNDHNCILIRGSETVSGFRFVSQVL